MSRKAKRRNSWKRSRFGLSAAAVIAMRCVALSSAGFVRDLANLFTIIMRPLGGVFTRITKIDIAFSLVALLGILSLSGGVPPFSACLSAATASAAVVCIAYLLLRLPLWIANPGNGLAWAAYLGMIDAVMKALGRGPQNPVAFVNCMLPQYVVLACLYLALARAESGNQDTNH
jgi:hypothetical protein